MGDTSWVWNMKTPISIRRVPGSSLIIRTFLSIHFKLTHACSAAWRIARQKRPREAILSHCRPLPTILTDYSATTYTLYVGSTLLPHSFQRLFFTSFASA